MPFSWESVDPGESKVVWNHTTLWNHTQPATPLAAYGCLSWDSPAQFVSLNRPTLDKLSSLSWETAQLVKCVSWKHEDLSSTLWIPCRESGKFIIPALGKERWIGRAGGCLPGLLGETLSQKIKVHSLWGAYSGTHIVYTHADKTSIHIK